MPSGRKFPRQARGKPIAAATINAPLAVIEAFDNLSSAAGIDLVKLAGVPAIRPASAREFPARITGAPSSGAYPWQGIYQESGGSWPDLAGLDDNGGNDPAYEINGNSSVPVGTRVMLNRNPTSGRLTFANSAC